MQTKSTPTLSNGNSVASRRPRSLFIPGFALGFLLLSLLSCGGGLYAVGIDAGRIAELRSGSTAWTPPPTIVPALVLEPAPAIGDALSRHTYAPGDRPRNVTSSLVNIRRSPGYLGKASDDVVAQAVPGQQVEILEGPQTEDGLAWWYVQLLTTGKAQDGWIAEATGSGVQILGE